METGQGLPHPSVYTFWSTVVIKILRPSFLIYENWFNVFRQSPDYSLLALMELTPVRHLALPIFLLAVPSVTVIPVPSSFEP